MSWLNPSTYEQELLDDVKFSHSEIVKLAKLVSLASKVESLLLRNIRMQFLPETESKLEFDLWFSQLVSARSSMNFVLHQGVARILANELQKGSNPGLKVSITELWEFTELHSRHWSPRDRLAQKLRFFVLNRDFINLQKGIRDVLRDIHETKDEEQNLEWARWAKKNLPVIADSRSKPIDEIALLAQFAANALGATAEWTKLSRPFPLPEWLNTALPRPMAISQLGIQISSNQESNYQVLEFISAKSNTQLLNLPSPLPAKIHISDHGWRVINKGSRIRLEGIKQHITLTTISGAQYELIVDIPRRIPKSSDSHYPKVFISYAHVDNKPFSGLETGWITHFVTNLQLLINRKIGRSEDYSLWQDFRLTGNNAIIPEIETRVRGAQVLLVFLSPGWIASEWCQKELRLFCEEHNDIKDRIFVIELDPLQRKEKPIVFHDLLSYCFWIKNEHGKIRRLGFPVPQVSDADYYDRLIDLSSDIAQELTSFKTDIAEETLSYAPKATIYVAPVNDALYDQRATLVSELKQFQIAVLPGKNALIADAASELDKCSHFVQLLSADSMMGIPQQQLAIAEKAGKPVMQWRDPQLNIAADRINQEHKQLLEHKTVIAAALPDFVRKVRETVLAKDPAPGSLPFKQSGKKMIFVLTGQEDFPQAQAIAAFLQRKGYGFILPSYDGTPERIRKSIERGFQFCDVLLVLQQRTAAEVIEDHLFDAQLQKQKRETAFDILLCRDPAAEMLSFLPPSILTLDCNSNFHEHCLEQFLQQVKA